MTSVFLILANGPAVFTVVGFAPPAIQNGEVQRAVDGRLHAGCAAGFQRTTGRVQPHIHTLDQVTRKVHVVIFDEDQASARFSAFDGAIDLLDELLAGFISRMRLARKDDLHRHVRAVDDMQQAFHI
ncbi:MAG: hypothetical protein MZV64_62555 [Ignavibacteriales bacterium]|nr:hypothetical protein [Ignavibacteriales bacterium]